ncbi:DUF805 domain-containing protein [Bradyrhizobium manausense]|uniref:DUF805 domain-containing protein n=1 Tax=Bradyrhizobium manausense TaxID=989370 RepID=UPI001BAB74A7|nr:DUF805 domain-containing protein [Bradyrhizobium manausense]MBR1089774.1 DUF805 domain-containing protein [Bradyrhizobium manausense]
MDWTWYLFRFDGRINRALLWQALLIVAVLAALLENISPLVGLLDGSRSAAKLDIEFDFDFGLDDLFRVVEPNAWRLLASIDRLTLILKGFGTPLFLWIYLATAIKRLHDRDRSGWWTIPFFFAPNLLLHLSDRLLHWPAPLDWASYAFWVWGLVEMFIVPGTSGANRFGPDPLAVPEDDAPAAPEAKSWDQQSEIEIVPPSASPPGGMHVKRGA